MVQVLQHLGISLSLISSLAFILNVYFHHPIYLIGFLYSRLKELPSVFFPISNLSKTRSYSIIAVLCFSLGPISIRIKEKLN